ncbi:MAG: cysteine desulfurase family protein [Chitinophagaceae bacterium]
MKIDTEQIIYLDNAATTQLDDEVLAEMMPFYSVHYGNPSSIHTSGIKTRVAIEQARKSIASLLGVKPHTIIFTSGGTESNNLAVLAGIRDFGCASLITSKIEHPSVINASNYYTRHFGIGIKYVKLESDGSIDLEDFERLLEASSGNGKKCLVSLMHANNEIANITDISGIDSICKKYGAFFHSDCVQTIGHYPLNLDELGMDIATASAHKFHGPKGIGFLYVREGSSLKPLIWGGDQERKFRAGTENVSGIVGMAKAMRLFHERFERVQCQINDLKKYFIEQLKQNFPGLIINGGSSALYSVLSVSFPKEGLSENFLFQLDQNGICVSVGSACSGGNSHVMEELGRTQDYVTIRFSFSKYNTNDEINKVVETLIMMVNHKFQI